MKPDQGSMYELVREMGPLYSNGLGRPLSLHHVSHGEANHDPYKYTDDELEYLYGYSTPHYPVPAIPQIHQWDYSLWCLLENMPTLSVLELEREGNEWQDYLDYQDFCERLER